MSIKIDNYLKNMSDQEKREMLEGEYLRRLTRYKKIDEAYRQKYKMTFEEFESKNIVAKKNFSWDVESDAQEWETVIDGIETMLTKLKELQIAVR